MIWGYHPLRKHPYDAHHPLAFRLISTFSDTEPLKVVFLCAKTLIFGHWLIGWLGISSSHIMSARQDDIILVPPTTTGTAGSKVGGPEFRLKFGWLLFDIPIICLVKDVAFFPESTVLRCAV